MSRSERDMHLLGLSAAVKRTYLEERRQFYLRTRGEDTNFAPRRSKMEEWDGGKDARGAVHGSAWERIVKFAAQHSVDPIELIRASFEVENGNEPPLPNMISSLSALKKLQYAKENNVDDMKRRFECYAAEAEMRFLVWRKYRNVSDEQVWKEVVASSELSFSSLFRFMLARSLQLKQAEEFWRDAAMKEYIRAPSVYDEALGDTIPADFREESARVIKLLNRGH